MANALRNPGWILETVSAALQLVHDEFNDPPRGAESSKVKRDGKGWVVEGKGGPIQLLKWESFDPPAGLISDKLHQIPAKFAQAACSEYNRKTRTRVTGDDTSRGIFALSQTRVAIQISGSKPTSIEFIVDAFQFQGSAKQQVWGNPTQVIEQPQVMEALGALDQLRGLAGRGSSLKRRVDDDDDGSESSHKRPRLNDTSDGPKRVAEVDGPESGRKNGMAGSSLIFENWSHLDLILRRFVHVSKVQGDLLTPTSSWYPPEAGKRPPTANIPTDVFRELQEAANNPSNDPLKYGTNDVDQPDVDINDSDLEAERLAESLNEVTAAASSDESSEGSVDWSPSPERKRFAINNEPPDSSDERPAALHTLGRFHPGNTRRVDLDTSGRGAESSEDEESTTSSQPDEAPVYEGVFDLTQTQAAIDTAVAPLPDAPVLLGEVPTIPNLPTVPVIGRVTAISQTSSSNKQSQHSLPSPPTSEPSFQSRQASPQQLHFPDSLSFHPSNESGYVSGSAAASLFGIGATQSQESGSVQVLRTPYSTSNVSTQNHNAAFPHHTESHASQADTVAGVPESSQVERACSKQAQSISQPFKPQMPRIVDTSGSTINQDALVASFECTDNSEFNSTKLSTAARKNSKPKVDHLNSRMEQSSTDDQCMDSTSGRWKGGTGSPGNVVTSHAVKNDVTWAEASMVSQNTTADDFDGFELLMQSHLQPDTAPVELNRLTGEVSASSSIPQLSIESRIVSSHLAVIAQAATRLNDQNPPWNLSPPIEVQMESSSIDSEEPLLAPGQKLGVIIKKEDSELLSSYATASEPRSSSPARIWSPLRGETGPCHDSLDRLPNEQSAVDSIIPLDECTMGGASSRIIEPATGTQVNEDLAELVNITIRDDYEPSESDQSDCQVAPVLDYDESPPSTDDSIQLQREMSMDLANSPVNEKLPMSQAAVDREIFQNSLVHDDEDDLEEGEIAPTSQTSKVQGAVNDFISHQRRPDIKTEILSTPMTTPTKPPTHSTQRTTATSSRAGLSTISSSPPIFSSPPAASPKRNAPAPATNVDVTQSSPLSWKARLRASLQDGIAGCVENERAKKRKSGAPSALKAVGVSTVLLEKDGNSQPQKGRCHSPSAKEASIFAQHGDSRAAAPLEIHNAAVQELPAIKISPSLVLIDDDSDVLTSSGEGLESALASTSNFEMDSSPICVSEQEEDLLASSQVEPTQVEGSQVEGSQVEGSQAEGSQTVENGPERPPKRRKTVRFNETEETFEESALSSAEQSTRSHLQVQRLQLHSPLSEASSAGSLHKLERLRKQESEDASRRKHGFKSPSRQFRERANGHNADSQYLSGPKAARDLIKLAKQRQQRRNAIQAYQEQIRQAEQEEFERVEQQQQQQQQQQQEPEAVRRPAVRPLHEAVDGLLAEPEPEELVREQQKPMPGVVGDREPDQIASEAAAVEQDPQVPPDTTKKDLEDYAVRSLMAVQQNLQALAELFGAEQNPDSQSGVIGMKQGLNALSEQIAAERSPELRSEAMAMEQDLEVQPEAEQCEAGDAVTGRREDLEQDLGAMSEPMAVQQDLEVLFEAAQSDTGEDAVEQIMGVDAEPQLDMDVDPVVQQAPPDELAVEVREDSPSPIMRTAPEEVEAIPDLTLIDDEPRLEMDVDLPFDETLFEDSPVELDLRVIPDTLEDDLQEEMTTALLDNEAESPWDTGVEQVMTTAPEEQEVLPIAAAVPHRASTAAEPIDLGAEPAEEQRIISIVPRSAAKEKKAQTQAPTPDRAAAQPTVHSPEVSSQKSTAPEPTLTPQPKPEPEPEMFSPEWWASRRVQKQVDRLRQRVERRSRESGVVYD